MDISGIGLQATIRASVTFPVGFTVTQFADDADPVDVPSIQIADKGMGLNGDLVTWGKANPIIVTLNVIPGSTDDVNLSTLLEANRVAKNKRSARDVITCLFTYPDLSVVLLSKGAITDGMPFDGVQSSARKKTKAYAFAFENKTQV